MVFQNRSLIKFFVSLILIVSFITLIYATKLFQMNRRSVIKNFLFVSAGVSLIPSCMHDKGKASFLLKNISINGDQEKMLANLTETIIPKTDTPGANDLSSHLFVMMMVDDCFKKDDRQKFQNGLVSFENLVKKRYGSSFVDCTTAQKKELLTDIEKKNNVPDDIVAFYNITKRLTIQSFVSSQYYLTKVQVYELVPGRWHGCVPVKNS